MFEARLKGVLQDHRYGVLGVIVLALTAALSGINYFLGGNALVLVALVSLAIAHPLIAYFESLNRDELSRSTSIPALLDNHLEETVTTWSVFVAATAGFYAAYAAGLVTDFTFEKRIMSGIQGMVTSSTNGFVTILVNNVAVAAYTFAICLVAFSGLAFIVSLNASILAYYAHSQAGLLATLLALPHGLLEVGGYVFAGIAGSVVALRFSAQHLSHESVFAKDVFILLTGALAFILIGAGVEIL